MKQDKPVFKKRRIYIVKRGLQFRYIGIIFLLVLLASVVTGYTVFTTGWTLLGEKLANVYPQGRLVYVFKTTNMTLIRNLLFVFPFIFILGLIFSHRIAGPVYRIEKSVDEIARGNLALKIELRKGDELWDLAVLINTMAENLNNSIVLNKKAVIEMQKELDIIKKTISTQHYDLSTITPSLDNLQARIEELSSSLDKWTTKS